MFTLSVNSVCKHFVDNGQMHETTRRLYEAVASLTGGKLSELGEVAAFVGVTPQVLKNWESRGVSKEGRLAIYQARGIDPQWLQSGEGPMHPGPVPISMENNPDYPAIRRVHFKLSAGASGFGVDYEGEDAAPIVFRREWYERNGYQPGKLLAVRVGNGSMEPGLYDGDTVVVNTADTTPADGVVFAINYEGEMVIKRLVRDGGQWWLASDNPDQRRYPRKVCDEHAFLLGRIVHKQSEKI